MGAAGAARAATGRMGRALRTALGGLLAHHRRCHPDRLRTAAIRAGRRGRTVSRVARLRISRPRRIRTARTRLTKTLPSPAAASIRSSCLGWLIRRPPSAAGSNATSLPRPRRSRAGGTAPTAARGAAGRIVRYGRSRRLAAELLHGPLLLGERHPLHRRVGAAAEKVNVLRSARNAGHRTVRIPEIRGAGRHRQLTAHQAGLTNLGAGSPRDIAEPSLPEIRSGDR